MKKYLLLFLVIFICLFSFAKANVNFTPEIKFTEADTSKINIYDLQTLKLYPNPANDFLYIDYEIVFLKEAKINIYNSIGSVVYTAELKEKADKLKVSVSEFESGLYFCSLQVDGKPFNTKKVLINHR